MTRKEYEERREQLVQSIKEYTKAKDNLEKNFIDEHRQIKEACAVLRNGEKHWFTGNIHVDSMGHLLYELLHRDMYLIYVLFKDLEVIQ